MRWLILVLVTACGGKEAAPSKPLAAAADAGVADAYVVFESMTGNGEFTSSCVETPHDAGCRHVAPAFSVDRVRTAQQKR